MNNAASTGVLVDPRAFIHEYAASALVGRPQRTTRAAQTTIRSATMNRAPVKRSTTNRGTTPATSRPRTGGALTGQGEPGSRQTLAGLVVLFVLMAAGLLWSQVARANDVPSRPPSAVAHRVVNVQPGDSLWSIARSLQPTGDVRPLVDAMIAERGSSVLRVGDTVMVPLSGP